MNESIFNSKKNVSIYKVNINKGNLWEYQKDPINKGLCAVVTYRAPR